MDAEIEDDNTYGGDQLIPDVARTNLRNAGVKSDKVNDTQGHMERPMVNLQDLKQNSRELYKDVLDDVEGNYDSPDQIPNEIPLMQISSPDLRKLLICWRLMTLTKRLKECL